MASIALAAIGAISACSAPVTTTGSVPAGRHTRVALDMSVTLDEVAAGAPGKVGQVDHLRLVYDASTVDPRTSRVRLLSFQHLDRDPNEPPVSDPTTIPTEDSWLDLSRQPYRLHFNAAVVHGQAIIIQVDENTGRLSIHPQSDPSHIIEAGPYKIDPHPVPVP